MKQFVVEWNRGASGRGDAPPRARVHGRAIDFSDGALRVVGDVRIDGRDELRRALAAAGQTTDADVPDGALILAAWRAWGSESARRLIGDFSFALWDETRPGMYCARDALGVRPLYYVDRGGVFACSNVLAALRTVRSVSAALHEPAIASFLECGWNRDLTTTSFSDIRRLAPAHQIAIGPAGQAVIPRRHWTFPAPAPLHYRTDDEYVEHFRALLMDVVRDRMRDGVPALMLSGGLDSTGLAVVMRTLCPEAAIAAFTADVGAIVANEDAALATRVAQRLGLDHTVVDDIPVALEHLADPDFRPPEPLDEPEYAAWRRMMIRADAVAHAVVFGEDGDALFAPPGLWRTLRAWPVAATLSRLIRGWIQSGRRPHLGINWRARVTALRQPAWTPVAWLRRDVAARVGDLREPDHGTHPTRPEAMRFLSGTIWQSVHEVFSPAYSGASAEIRWPLLDVRLLAFALAIPPYPWCQRKTLLRETFRPDLPIEVLARPKTTLRGYDAVQVNQWRTTVGGTVTPFAEKTLQFVDSRRVHAALFAGTPADVQGAWRALALDRWLRDLG